MPSLVQWESRSIIIRYQRAFASRRRIRQYVSYLEHLREELESRLQVSLSDKPLTIILGGGEDDSNHVPDTFIRASVINTSLDRAILAHWLRESLGVALPALFLDGIRAYLSSNHGISSLDLLLKHAIQEGIRFSIHDYLISDTQPMYHDVTHSFVVYLIDIHGKETFLDFARQLSVDSPDLAAENVYHLPFSVLGVAWLTQIQAAKLPLLSVAGFIRRMLSYLRPHTSWVILLLVAILMRTAWYLVSPIIFRNMVNAISVPNVDAIFEAAEILTGLIALRFIGKLGMDTLGAWIGAKAANTLRLKAFRHIQNLPSEYFERLHGVDLASVVINGTGAIEAGFSEIFPLMVGLAIQVAAGLVFLALLNLPLTIIAVMILIFAFYVIPKLVGQSLNRATQIRARVAGGAAAIIRDNILNQDLMKSYWMADRRVERLKAQLDEYPRINRHFFMLVSLIGTGSSSIGFVAQIVILTIASVLVVNGQLTIGELIAFDLYIRYTVSAIDSWSGLVKIYQDIRVSFHTIQELLYEPAYALESEHAQPMPPFNGAIKFNDVTFSYDGTQTSLHHLNTTIHKHNITAVVGSSGSGKSTLFSLLLRLYDPTEGNVEIDGSDLRFLALSSLREQIAIVFQEPHLVNASVLDNIRIGQPNATLDEVKQAAHAAEIHHFIESLPEGYDTILYDQGKHLSGGQKQRFALAAALLRRPEILLLDEVTSALDPAAEAATLLTIQNIKHQCTVIMSTHRLAIAQHADDILVMQDGYAVEQGSHESLMAGGQLYAELWHKQSGFTIDEQSVTVTPQRLKAIPLFSHLEDNLLQELSEQFTTQHYDENETIFAEGDPGDKFYVLVRGQVAINTTSGNRPLLLSVLEDGDYFGEMALRHDVPRTATAQTLIPSIMLILKRDLFTRMLDKSEALRSAIDEAANNHSLHDLVMRGRRKRSSIVDKLTIEEPRSASGNSENMP